MKRMLAGGLRAIVPCRLLVVHPGLRSVTDRFPAPCLPLKRDGRARLGLGR